METPALLPLPLHPRRAQQLFQEILLTDAQSTPELSCQALPQRLHQLQRLNLSGVHEAKRGTTFQRIRTAADAVLQIETETVTLRLAKDGSTLQIALEGDYSVAVSIPLLDIQAIILHTTPVHSFSFQLDSCGDGCDNNIGNATVNENASDFSDIFISTSDEILNRWIVTLTSPHSVPNKAHSSEMIRE
ncbi:hypothetical protein BBP00_00008106 [Phytophthora kernoviae]|uniref:PH domain-containing protein n=1 Tax=Phytophthora kernoviae TaxID=325452 RepID=A0A3F2RGG3_9STRA|nr:hypothetical protein BBP00_00008106 [Phytophthora kernoviae]